MYTYTSFKPISTVLFLILFSGFLTAQEKEPLIQRLPASDSTKEKMNMDAVYNRPFLTMDKMPVAIGGYLEVNSLYSSTDGAPAGLEFQARRLTLFMSSSVTNRIRFLTEIEFEGGAEEIGIEFAAIDVDFHSAAVFRGGIIMNPIGSFNQNHDGPKWEFVERPDVSVNLLPATWSNAGFGMYGKVNKNYWILGYEIYLTNGFDNSIIDNEENKLFLPAAKNNENRFMHSTNGQPLLTAKTALKNRKIGELGLSYMGGIYNEFETDGIVVDDRRYAHVVAGDLTVSIKKTGTVLTGECAFVFLDVPSTYTKQYGSRQWGLFADVVQPVLKREKATLNVAARFDFVDWNQGTFEESDTKIGDELIAITPAISFRPTSQTVFRLNYRYQWQTDLFGNPPFKTASWLFGLSTYF